MKDVFAYEDGEVVYTETTGGISVDISERNLETGEVRVPEMKELPENEKAKAREHGARLVKGKIVSDKLR